MKIDRPTLNTLPNELLCLLPDLLHTIEDLLAFSSTCRILHMVALGTNPRTILRLVAACSKDFIAPNPYFLVAATAASLRSWVLQDMSRIAPFQEALRGGMNSLLDFCVEHGSLSWERIATLRSLRLSTVQLVVKFIDQCFDARQHTQRGFWTQPITDTKPPSEQAHVTFYHLMIYSELFGAGVEFDSFLDAIDKGIPYRPAFSLEVRFDFIKYCMPDSMSFQNQACRPARSPSGSLIPLRIVLPIGPYVGDVSYLNARHQGAMFDLLTHHEWNSAWAEVRRSANGEVGREGGWRQELWRRMAMQPDIDGMAILMPGCARVYEVKLASWRARILKLVEPPESVVCGRRERKTTLIPNLQGDISICRMPAGY